MKAFSRRCQAEETASCVITIRVPNNCCKMTMSDFADRLNITYSVQVFRKCKLVVSVSPYAAQKERGKLWHVDTLKFPSSSGSGWKGKTVSCNYAKGAIGNSCGHSVSVRPCKSTARVETNEPGCCHLLKHTLRRTEGHTCGGER